MKACVLKSHTVSLSLNRVCSLKQSIYMQDPWKNGEWYTQHTHLLILMCESARDPEHRRPADTARGERGAEHKVGRRRKRLRAATCLEGLL